MKLTSIAILSIIIFLRCKILREKTEITVLLSRDEKNIIAAAVTVYHMIENTQLISGETGE